MINFKRIINETLSLFFFEQKVRTKVKSSNYMSRGRREEDKGAEGRKGLGRTPERRRRGIRIIKSCSQLILSSACRTIIICFFSDFVLRKHSLTWFDVDKEIRGRYRKKRSSKNCDLLIFLLGVSDKVAKKWYLGKYHP